MVRALPWFLLAYLVGAIPTSLIVGKLFRGIDLREHGSRNLGATNVYRVLGWKFAIPVAILDILKGTIPVVLFAPRVSPSLVTALLIGIAAIVGHVFSVFAGFKGGKGVATATGVMLGLTPAAVGIVATLWVLIVWLTGYVSLASIVGAAGLPVAVWFMNPGSRQVVWIDALVAVAIIWFHRANIRRLLNGTENRFGRRAETS
jgi:acyl phosphate:glycerol-3-phosphate acyltransferase